MVLIIPPYFFTIFYAFVLDHCHNYNAPNPAVVRRTLFQFSVMKATSSWRNGKNIAMEAVGLEFDSLAGQIGHSTANGSSPLRRFCGVCCAGAKRLR